jgi:cell wall-associated NlpC family hydrolase
MRLNLLFFLLLGFITGCAGLPAPRPDAPLPLPLVKQTDPEALFHALATLGVDYRRGGHSPASGFDCSGLVTYIYREAYGIDLPHYTLAQSRYGKAVEHSALELGDLVFYNTERQPYSHVGIYLGEGRFIHAPRPGASVRVEKMASSYWSKRFDGARRIVASGD